MKWFGLLLIVVAGSGLGMYYSRRLFRRVTALSQTERLLDALEGQLAYTADPLEKLFRDLAADEAFSDFFLLRQTVTGLEKHPFEQAYRHAVEQGLGEGLFLPEDRQLLLEFGDQLGRSGLIQQVAHIRHYRDRLHESCDAARQTAQTRGNVYRVMGVAGGIALALLLL